MLQLVSNQTQGELNSRKTELTYKLDRAYTSLKDQIIIEKEIKASKARSYANTLIAKTDTELKRARCSLEIKQLVTEFNSLRDLLHGDVANNSLALVYSKPVEWIDVLRARAAKPNQFQENQRKHLNHKMPPSKRRY